MVEMNVNKNSGFPKIRIKTIVAFVLLIIITIAAISVVMDHMKQETSSYKNTPAETRTDSKTPTGTEIGTQETSSLTEKQINYYTVETQLIEHIDPQKDEVIDIAINKNGLSHIHIETKEVYTEKYGNILISYITIVPEEDSEGYIKDLKLNAISYIENVRGSSRAEGLTEMNKEWGFRIGGEGFSTKIVLEWSYKEQPS